MNIDFGEDGIIPNKERKNSADVCMMKTILQESCIMVLLTERR